MSNRSSPSWAKSHYRSNGAQQRHERGSLCRPKATPVAGHLTTSPRRTLAPRKLRHFIKGHLSCTVERSSCMERVAIAVKDGGAGCAAWGQPHFVLAPKDPRQGGLFGFKISSWPHPRKFGLKRFLAVRKVL